MAQPFQQLPGKDGRRVENAVPGLARGKRSLGWTASKKQLEVAQVLEVLSLLVGLFYLGSFLIVLVDVLDVISFTGVIQSMAGPSFIALVLSTLLFGFADMVSGGRARLAGWIFLLVMPISLLVILNAMFC